MTARAKKILLTNGLTFAILVLVPLAAQAVDTYLGHPPGVGLNILLYFPFDFAYILLVLLSFLILNFKYARNDGIERFIATIGSFAMSAIWLVVSFILVVQHHWSLGGRL